MKEPVIVSNKTVYASVGSYVITLKLNNCKTNENRSNVSNPMCALFRCNKALVVNIKHKFTNKKENAHEQFSIVDYANPTGTITNYFNVNITGVNSINSVDDDNFTYVKGKYVIDDDYDDDSDKICAKGIFYCIAHKAAFFSNINGLVKRSNLW